LAFWFRLAVCKWIAGRRGEPKANVAVVRYDLEAGTWERVLVYLLVIVGFAFFTWALTGLCGCMPGSAGCLRNKSGAGLAREDTGMNRPREL